VRSAPTVIPNRLAEELRLFKNLVFKNADGVMVLPAPDEGSVARAGKTDYGKMSVKALRRLAGTRGVRGAAKLTKQNLIKKLEGNHGL